MKQELSITQEIQSMLGPEYIRESDLIRYEKNYIFRYNIMC
jgi:hypothetical protein